MHEPEQHVSPIKNWKQLVVVVVLAFVVPIAVIIILSQYITGTPKGADENDSAGAGADQAGRRRAARRCRAAPRAS